MHDFLNKVGSRFKLLINFVDGSVIRHIIHNEI